MTAKNEKTLQPFSAAQRRTVLSEAREAGFITYDKLDRLLLESARTQAKTNGLLRSLKGVEIRPSPDPDDILNRPLDPVSLDSSTTSHFARFADRIRRMSRLTRAEEHSLARRLEFARARMRQAIDAANLGLDADQREIVLSRGVRCLPEGQELAGDYPPIPCGKLTDAVLEAGADYNRLRSHFVQRNLYLVIGMSSAYRTYGMPMMDLIQEGNASLIRAVEKFDWRKDVRFQTYAAFWIRQALERMITANRGIVRVPNYVQQKLRRLRREGKLPRNHKDVDVRDMSRHFDTNTQTAYRLMETDRSWFSLDAAYRDDDDSPIAALLAAEEDDAGMSASEKRQLGARLDNVLRENLTEQEQDIITLRFGLGGERPHTLDQIGAQMSVSRERIRQMQVKALDKLQKPRLLEALKDFL